MIVVARKVSRIGVETLECEGDKWYVRIKNRSYESRVEIPRKKVAIWRKELA